MVKGLRRKKCCKCGKTVCYYVPDKNIGGVIVMRCQEEIPFRIKDGKYWCADCFNERSEK